MIRREIYLKRIRPFINKDVVKVITGIRRSGKSIMLQLIQQELMEQKVDAKQILQLNFEDLANRELCDGLKLNQWVLDRAREMPGKVYLFLDEVQEVPQWEKVINSLRVSLDIDIYITGSNARLLSGELATYLAGRYVQFTVYPFSYQEYLLANGAADSGQIFRQYITNGGMPFLLNLAYEPEASRQYLQDIYNSVVLKDVIQRNKLRDVELLERIVLYALGSIGQTFSAASIVKYLKSENRRVSNDTVLSYLNACTGAYLFNKIPRWDLAGKKVLTVNEKYYAADIGLRNAIYGNNDRDINQVLENIVCLELLHRGYRVRIGKVNDCEIDFVAEKDSRRMYIQVSYLLAGEDTINREFGVFRHIKDNYPKYVLSLDEFDFSREGIHHENIRHFLLRNDW